MSDHVDRSSADLPRTDPESDDELGLAPFARRLSSIIQQLDASAGYVIGLSGEWGSGKTTALNYTRHYIGTAQSDRSEDPPIYVIEFKPWLVSGAGHQELIGAFFKVLEEKLDMGPPRWKKAASSVADMASGLADGASKLAVLGSVLTGGTSALAGVAAKTALKQVADTLKQERSLQERYGLLRDVLGEQANRLLIVIDDIDRLQPEEIRAMMMLVKTVGQLPNVIYLLSYDHNIVWPALEATTKTSMSRTNFAEKLVQQEIMLPAPNKARLLGMLLDRSQFLTIDPSPKSRWGALLEVALLRWLRTPRDVIRLVNNMRFAWPVIENHLDPVDYVAIEGLRTFDRNLFNWLRDGADFFFGNRLHVHDRDYHFREAQTFKASLAPGDRENAARMIGFLFPSFKQFFEFESAEAAQKKPSARIFEREEQVRARLGLAFSESYDAYFQLYEPRDVVGRATLAAFFSRVDDEEFLFGSLSEASTKRRKERFGWTIPLFQAVGDRIDEEPAKATEALLRAVLRVYDQLNVEDSQALHEAISPVQRLLNTLMGLRPDHEVRSLLVDRERPVSLFTASTITAQLHRRVTHIQVDDDIRSAIVEAIGSEVKDRSVRGELQDLPALGDPVFVWACSNGGLDSVRSWIADVLSKPWFIPKMKHFFIEDMIFRPGSNGRYTFGPGAITPTVCDMLLLSDRLGKYIIETDVEDKGILLIAEVVGDFILTHHLNRLAQAQPNAPDGD